MKRIIMHWTAGSYNVSSIDKQHYHFIISGEGKVVNGDFPVSANEGKLVPGKYAAHTLNCNTGSIGISMACMRDAIEGKTHGPDPMTELQHNVMCSFVARLCVAHNIKVTDKTVLSHAEVQPNLGIKQRGKWDFSVLPFKPELKGAKACGDYTRQRVMHFMNLETGNKPATPKPQSETKPVEKLTLWQQILNFFGVK